MPQLSNPRLRIIYKYLEGIEKHSNHPWIKYGRCVYCGPCGVRLGQGNIPKDHPIYVPPKKPHVDDSSDKIRKLWGKDA